MLINIDRITGKVVNSISPVSYQIKVEDGFNPSKTIEVQEGMKQKQNENGQLLYKTNLKKDETGKEIFEETTENRAVTKTGFKKVTNKWIDEEGKEESETIIVKEPVEWENLEPIIIPNIISKVINFKDNPTEFAVEEIAGEKFKSLLETSNCDHILADLFLNEDDIDLTDKDHSANTGVALLQLLPKGQAKTKEIKLDAAAKEFKLLEFEADPGAEVYINDTKFVNAKAELNEAVDKCTIKFVNNTDKFESVKSYAIGY